MTQLLSRSAFYKFGGELGRREFVLNSLILGAIGGALFPLLGVAAGPTDANAYLLLAIGMVGGPIIVLTSGLTSLWIGLAGAVIFFLAPFASSGPRPLALSFILTGLIAVYLVVLFSANVTKRIRAIGGGAHPYAWTVMVWMLCLIPLVGTGLYYGLIILRKRGLPRDIEAARTEIDLKT